MSTLKLLALCFLFNGIMSESDHGLGYLIMNMSSPFAGHDKFCSVPNVATKRMCSVDYMVEPKHVAMLLPIINHTINTLNYYQGVNSSCRESVREYKCLNSIPICDDQNGTLSYNVKKTELACSKAKVNCPATVTEHIIDNCTRINDRTVPLARCLPLPSSNGTCPTKNYKVTQTSVDAYKTAINAIKPYLDIIKGYPLVSNLCKEKLRNLLCYISGGPACSKDGKLLVHAISSQDCDQAIKKCVGQSLSGLESLCVALPNATIAKRVPLPPDLSADAILSVAGDKTRLPLVASTTQPTVQSSAVLTSPSVSISVSTTKSPGGSASYLSPSYFVSFSSFLIIVNKLFLGVT